MRIKLTLVILFIVTLGISSQVKALPQSVADTVYLAIENDEDLVGVTDGDFVVNIFVSLHTGTLTGATLGITWDRQFVRPTPDGTIPISTSQWQFDSLIYQGDFTVSPLWFSIPPVDVIADSVGAITAGGFTFAAGVPPGSNLLMAKLYLSLKPNNNWAPGSRVTIDSSFVPPSSDFLVVFGNGAVVIPTFLGAKTVKYDPSLCCETAGDFNNDSFFNIADVTAGIAYIFLDGAPAPFCQDQADSNSDSVFNISDIVYDIATIFTAGPVPSVELQGDKATWNSYSYFLIPKNHLY